jgi:hypothetical protein
MNDDGFSPVGVTIAIAALLAAILLGVAVHPLFFLLLLVCLVVFL